jgi:hypothetical protein
MKKKIKKQKLVVDKATIRKLENLTEVIGGGVVPLVSAGCVPGSACTNGRSGCGYTQ